MKLKAFILSAGLGERLRPITEDIPKPLLPIFGKSILEMIIEKISKLKLDEMGINLYYKKEMIINSLKKSNIISDIKIFLEEDILGTGGGIKNAEDFLKDSIFIVHNADIISDIRLENIIKEHLSNRCIATLAINREAECRNIIIDSKGYLKDIRKPAPEEEAFTFTGIAIYSPEILRYIPEGNSSITTAWLNAIKDDEKIKTYDVSGSFWADIGTPLTYAKTLINLLKKNGETVYIDSNAVIEGKIDGYVVIERDVIIKRGSCIKDCIVLRGEIHGRYEDAIISGEKVINLHGYSIHGVKKGEPILIGTGGSDREYFRIKKDDNSFVLMKSKRDDPDFLRYINYSMFFRRHSIPVAEIIRIDEDTKSVILDDLGDITLYSYMKYPLSLKSIIKIYRDIIDILIRIHVDLTKHIDECPILKERVFDYEHLRWESNYFLERFIKDILKMYDINLDLLHNEFDNLAMKVDSYPKCVIHRDLQSQNIMIKDKKPFIIDFQGARIGPPSYDLASILWDPYTPIHDSIRKKILNYYIEKMKDADQKFNEDKFLESLIYTKIQRHMQALGAYGFLSSIKGKRYFLKFIPSCLGLLEQDIKEMNDQFPMLYKLVLRAVEILNKTDINEAVTSLMNS